MSMDVTSRGLAQHVQVEPRDEGRGYAVFIRDESQCVYFTVGGQGILHARQELRAGSRIEVVQEIAKQDHLLFKSDYQYHRVPELQHHYRSEATMVEFDETAANHVCIVGGGH